MTGPSGTRAAILIAAGLTAVATAISLGLVLAGIGVHWLIGTLLVVLFVPLTANLALSFWAAMAGFLGSLGALSVPGPQSDSEQISGRTAILIPIYNEDPEVVFANVQAMYESLRATGLSSSFDFFVLSDTTDPTLWLQEQAAWQTVCARTGGNGRIFYRRRPLNTARKTGNIADFCERWGSKYQYMITLDADSVLEGRTAVRLVRCMESNPRAGLVQTAAAFVNGRTLFSRCAHFAGSLYGRLDLNGQAAWQLGNGNYWGHNAIIRVEAFTQHCGLPAMHKRAPFRGHYLSHDFIEAALLKRAGWEVWLAPDVSGAYEESPPNLVDHLIRQRRWCQGNLQHLNLLAAAGLTPLSRLHLVIGICGQISGPLSLVFSAGLLVTSMHSPERSCWGGALSDCSLGWSAEWFGVACVVTMLFVPRLLGLIAALATSSVRTAHGGAIRIAASAVVEWVLSILLWPAMALSQAAFVITILLGRDSGWKPQRRECAALPVREAARVFGGHTAAGVAMVGALCASVLPLWYWPMAVGLLLSIPLACVTGSEAVDRRFRRRLLLTPEQTSIPAILARSDEVSRVLRGQVGRLSGRPVPEMVADPAVHAIHTLTSRIHPLRSWGCDDLLDDVRAKTSEGAELTSKDLNILLYDENVLSRLTDLQPERTEGETRRLDRRT
ncbi:glucans biosynthesis glucosyltransferase MdoH [Kribbella sp. NPDC004138]